MKSWEDHIAADSFFDKALSGHRSGACEVPVLKDELVLMWIVRFLVTLAHSVSAIFINWCAYQVFGR